MGGAAPVVFLPVNTAIKGTRDLPEQDRATQVTSWKTLSKERWEKGCRPMPLAAPVAFQPVGKAVKGARGAAQKSMTISVKRWVKHAQDSAPGGFLPVTELFNDLAGGGGGGLWKS